MTRKLQTQDDLGLRHFLRKEQLKAEHPKDVGQPSKHHPLEPMPRNPNTHVSIRLPQDLCDWIWLQYPNEPTISSAVQQYLKDQYGIYRKASSV